MSYEQIVHHERIEKLEAVLEAAKKLWWEDEGVMVLDAGSWELNVLKEAIGAIDERYLKGSTV
jgi:hypothetical protein